MKFMILTYESPEDFAARSDTERQGQYWAAWKAFGGAMSEAGIIVSMHGLHPAHTATTVRLINGNRQVQNGAFADTKDQIGGYFIIEVPDLDNAIEWAGRCPAAVNGAVEIRPVL